MSEATLWETIDTISNRWRTPEAWPSADLLGDVDWLLRVATVARGLDEVINEFLPEHPEGIADHAQALQDVLYAPLKPRAGAASGSAAHEQTRNKA